MSNTETHAAVVAKRKALVEAAWHASLTATDKNSYLEGTQESLGRHLSERERGVVQGLIPQIAIESRQRQHA